MVKRASRADPGPAIQTKEEMADNYEKETTERPKKKPIYKDDLVISTSSTLLDKAIFGGRQPEGGVPGGTIIEIFGPEGIGKTAILAEICGNAQARGGEAKFRDPEGRLDREYAEIYGMSLEGDNYKRTHDVTEIFDDIMVWDPPNKDAINVFGCDSLAALVTELEMGEKGDKMGMRRAKEFSQGFRKISTLIAEGGHKLLACTNQIREGDSGRITPGGWAIRFYSSIRLDIRYFYKGGVKGGGRYITKDLKVGEKNKEVSKVIGINCVVKVVKNSKDDPYREAPISIVFGYGIDDIRANLQWYKDMTGGTVYECGDGQTYQAMDPAIKHIEANDLENGLRENVIDLWNEIEEKFKKKALIRKRKKR